MHCVQTFWAERGRSRSTPITNNGGQICRCSEKIETHTILQCEKLQCCLKILALKESLPKLFFEKRQHTRHWVMWLQWEYNAWGSGQRLKLWGSLIYSDVKIKSGLVLCRLQLPLGKLAALHCDVCKEKFNLIQSNLIFDRQEVTARNTGDTPDTWRWPGCKTPAIPFKATGHESFHGWIANAFLGGGSKSTLKKWKTQFVKVCFPHFSTRPLAQVYVFLICTKETCEVYFSSP